jgi:hypothetical protein
METALTVLGVWTAVSIPSALFIGRFIRVGAGPRS